MARGRGNLVRIYRAGIVGLRGIGANRPAPALHRSLGTQEPYSHASAYAAVPRTRVVAVCDLIPERREKFVATWSDTWPEIHPYADHRELLQSEDLDILSIATPDHRHTQIFIDGCEAGVKAIFTEKPFATSLADADRMIAAAEAKGVVVTVDHTRRWWPGNLQARAELRKGTIGQLKRIVFTECAQRSMLFRNGCHALDRICFFADSDPTEVFGQLDPGFENYGPRYAADGGRDPRLDPGASAYITFANGVRAFVNFSQDVVPHAEVLLMGDKGWIRLGGWGQESPVEVAVQDEATGTLRRFLLPDERYSHVGGMQAAVEEILDVLEHGGETLSPPREARKSVELILAILQSQHLGGKLVRLPFMEEVPPS
jgi:predicted dehydrogenase